jgi:hypothetical protein
MKHPLILVGVSEETLIQAEQHRLLRAQRADQAELNAMDAAPATGSMADYERARKVVLIEDMAHRDQQLRWLTSRLRALDATVIRR